MSVAVCINYDYYYVFDMLQDVTYVFHCSVRPQSHPHVCRKNDRTGDDRGGLCLNPCNDVALDLIKRMYVDIHLPFTMCLTTKLFIVNFCIFVKILQWSHLVFDILSIFIKLTG